MTDSQRIEEINKMALDLYYHVFGVLEGYPSEEMTSRQAGLIAVKVEANFRRLLSDHFRLDWY